MKNQDNFYKQFRKTCKQYFDFDDATFEEFKNITLIKKVQKGEVLQDTYSPAKYIYYICEGILRTFFLSENGSIYTKNLFSEHSFTASVVSLITQEDSYLNIEALEDSTLIYIDFEKYKKLIASKESFKIFYIKYIEKNWIIVKEKNEISLILDDAKTRYQNFVKNNPNIENRIALYHIANHLGITSTQLSRIRSSLKSTI